MSVSGSYDKGLPVGVIVYSVDDIIGFMDFEDSRDADITREIITDMDKEFRRTLNMNQTIKIPYIGKLTKNLQKIEFKRNRFEFLKSIKKSPIKLTKEEIRERIKQINRDSYKKVNDEQRFNVLFKKNKQANIKEYERRLVKMGKVMADMYIFSITAATPMPFDEELEEAYQKLFSDET